MQLFGTLWGGIIFLNNILVSEQFHFGSNSFLPYYPSFVSLVRMQQQLVSGKFIDIILGIDPRETRRRSIPRALGGGRSSFQIENNKIPGPESVIDGDIICNYLSI